MPPRLAPVMTRRGRPSAARSDGPEPTRTRRPDPRLRVRRRTGRHHRGGGVGPAQRLADLREPRVKVHRSQVERELGCEQLEEGQDVVGGPCHGLGRELDSAAAQLAQREGSALVPFVDPVSRRAPCPRTRHAVNEADQRRRRLRDAPPSASASSSSARTRRSRSPSAGAARRTRRRTAARLLGVRLAATAEPGTATSTSTAPGQRRSGISDSLQAERWVSVRDQQERVGLHA